MPPAKNGIAMAADPKLGEVLKSICRPANVAASILIDIITASTREKDGGEFHNIDGGRHPW